MALCFGGDWKESIKDDHPLCFGGDWVESCEEYENEEEMTEKFTPGVWDWYVTDGGDGYPAIFSLRMDGDIANLCIVNNDYEQSFANAALIAAAPDLFECVCDALTDLQMPEGMRNHFEQVLKKARGEE